MTGTKAIANHQIKLNMSSEEEQRVNDIYSKIRHTEPLISSDMMRLAAKSDSHFEGLSNSVKTADSIEDKLKRMHHFNAKTSPSQEIMQMHDLIRYTEIVKHENIPQATKKAIYELENQGYVHSGTKNYFSTPFKGTEYMGMHLNFISPYGSEIELQIHSEESLSAKHKGHDLYEQLRSVSCKQEIKDELCKDISKIHQSISKPKGYEDIHDFNLKKADRERIMQERMRKTAVLIRNNDNIEVYDVLKNGQKIMHGFEGRFSDGSMLVYQNDHVHRRARIASLTNKGIEISDTDAKSLELTPVQIDKILRHQEHVHDNWMQENIGDAEKEFICMLNEEQNVEEKNNSYEAER